MKSQEKSLYKNGTATDFGTFEVQNQGLGGCNILSKELSGLRGGQRGRESQIVVMKMSWKFKLQCGVLENLK